LEIAGRLDPMCPHTSDLNMWLRIAAVSDVAFLPGHPQALYRRHEENHSRGYLHSPPLNIAQRWTAYERFFGSLNGRAERSRWEASAREALAAEARYAATRAYVVDADSHMVDELNALAARLAPEAQSGLEDWAWKLRRWLGPERSRQFPPFWVRGARQRAHRQIAERRRVRKGV
jgi:hypothetical protein